MKILCTIIIYNTDIFKCNVFKSLISPNIDAIDKVIIFDNSPSKQTFSPNILGDKILYQWNEGLNLGISECYNYAAKFAQQNKYQWLLFLDQDTFFPKGAYLKYKSAIEDSSNMQVFVPIHIIKNTNRYLSPVNILKGTTNTKPRTGICSLSKITPINSGLLINIDAFINAGGYNSKIRVDFSDIQFFSKLKSVTQNISVLDIICIQDYSASETDKKKLFNRYKLYIEGYKNYSFSTITEKLAITYLVLKRTISLAFKTKEKIFINYFIKKINE